jgi:integrase
MASSPEHRGESVRITWLLGGRRGAAKQSVTFTGPPEGRLKLALAAKALVESRRHDITRDECYAAILGGPVEADEAVPTFAMWAKQWIADLEATGRVQADVRRRYEQFLRLRAVPYFGHKRITDIDREDIKAWVRSLRASHVTRGNKSRRPGSTTLKPQSVAKVFMVVSSCLAAAVPKWIAVNPAAPLPGERKNSVGLPAVGATEAMFLTAGEVERILESCRPEFRDLVFVAVRSGLRMGELIALEARHVVFDRQGGATILVRQALKSDGSVGAPKTPASRRDVPVQDETARIVARRVQGRRPSALVFTTAGGFRWDPTNLRSRYWQPAVSGAMRCAEHPPPAPVKPRSGPTRRWRLDEVSVCGCLGVLVRRPRFHDLRHTHASALIAQGWHVKKIQRRMGHSRFQTTMDVYGHLMDLGDGGELDSLEDFFTPPKVGRHPGLRGSVRRRAVSRSVLVRRSVSA